MRSSDAVQQAPGTWSRAAVVAGLVSLAVTQPVLDLLGRNPEFFVAGHYSSRQIVLFGFGVALVPAIAAMTVVAAAARLHRGLGTVVYQVALAGLGALFGNVLARGLDLDGGRVALIASVAGAAAALGIARLRPGRMLLEYLSVANLFFLVAFLVMSPASRLLSGGEPGDLGVVKVPTPPGPVVVIVFDELPITTLLRGDGTVNADRYPAFAELAERSTWHRNASGSHNRTERAVPSALTGNVTEPGQLPSYRDLPRNMLSLFAQGVPVVRYEAITDMCPPDVCASQTHQPLRQAFEDALTVYGHRVLPRRLRADLPAIDAAWGGFGDELGGAAPDDEDEDDHELFTSGDGGLARWHAMEASERSAASQAATLVEHGLDIDGDPALHFVHVVLPHGAWLITPWGTQLMGPMPEWVEDPSDPAYEASAMLRYQRHSLQTGAADVALGEVIDHLTESGVWDDTTLIVTADHGVSLLAPDFGREPTDANRDEVYRVPLFIKEAGQQEPAIVDEPAQGIDLLPTIIDLLDIETDWDFDGHSLLDGSEFTEPPLVTTDVQPVFDIARRHGEQFPLGDDWTGLAAVGELGPLVGVPLEDLTVGPPSSLAWAPSHEADFASLPTSNGGVPQVVTGRVAGSGDERPPDLLVVVNGTVAGIAHGYQRDGEDWRFFAFLGPYLRDGANEIVAYEVEDGPGGQVVHLVS